jgi:uncharacterized protein (DUF885 family)
MPKTIVALLAGVFVLALAAATGRPARADSAMDRRFEELADRYVDQFPALSPVAATQLGDHRFDGQLDQVTPEERAREVRFYREFLDELAKIDSARLSRANQVDRALLDHHLRAELWRLEKLQEWAWNPLVYTDLTGSAIYGLMAREFVPLQTRLGHVAERLEQFPRLLGQIRSALVPDRVPKIHAETAVTQNPGVVSILDNMVKPHLGELPDGERQRLELAMATAREAVEAHQKWLESELLPKAAGDFRLGAPLYDEKLAFTLQTPLSRGEIRRRAEEQLRLLRGKMYETAKEVYRRQHPLTRFPADPSEAYKEAIIRAGLELACRDAPPADGVVEAAKRSLAEATAFVRQKGLVTVPPDPLGVIVMPEFQRGVSVAYCDSPGPLDVGQKTFYAVSPLPSDWTPEQVRSFLREYNLRSIDVLTIHEAMPGHFVQLAHSNRYPGKLRAVLGSGVFIEGWACYVQRMMCEQGFRDGDPLMRLVLDKWCLREATNALLDQGIHTQGMTRDEGMRLMVEDGFQEEREAAGKWVRAQLTSAQLSTYFVGYLEHADLRREAEKAWGPKFNLKTYHDKILSFGSPPVEYVRAMVFDREIP